MSQIHPFTVYNASAGSGKTFTLVKEYLKILFASNNPDQYKRILAITFTNKAVAEMKDRIISELKTFSSPEILKNPEGMFVIICDELQIDATVLHKKAEKLLNNIIHNYAAFDISTIDGFTHRIIRTFAFDLKLPLNFEVELDQDSLLHEAVDSLIAKAGTDKQLTSVLVDFAIEKADDDKSWDVAFDFNKIAKLLVNENDLPFIETLKNKTLTDFSTLKKQLKTELKTTETTIVEVAQSVLNLIEEAGLVFTDFSRSTLPNHFKKASELSLDGLYNNKLEENLAERKGIYGVKSTLAPIIDAILPQIETYYKAVKQGVFHIKFLKAFYRNITPLSVLNVINNELKTIKEDQNKMLISEFNAIISKEISNQPTPFIYERLGEKFIHYFIDEFQDTSTMQWQNLIPLLGNSLAKDSGSVMLVGDAKQAIYRWRGGEAEQFIGLFHDEKPFVIDKKVKNLPINYRSFKEVVTFNNGFFNFLSSQVFSNPIYKNLYEAAKQELKKTNEGYVQLSFLDIEKEDDKDELFTAQILKTIVNCLTNGFKLEDICVLVRKKKEGVAVANFLSKHGIAIISSETLLVNNAPEVAFVNNLMGVLIQPKNNELKLAVLNYLASHFLIDNKHEFFCKHLHLSTSEFFKSFETYNIYVNHQNLLQLPLFDLAETLVRSFGLVKTSNAYIQFYLDVVLDFSQKKGSDITAFLSYFDSKKENLSIVSPKGQDAVQIMTIHKSKGLEFPVVIFPYANLDIYGEMEPKEWFPINKEVYQGFSHTLLNFNSDFENFGAVGLEIFNTHKSEQELDNINLLYVALTRAVEQLYIISSKDINAKGEVNTKRYSGLLINYLQHLGVWNNSESTYSFGRVEKTSKDKVSNLKTDFQKEFISTSKESQNIKVVTKSGMLWDTNQEEAIEKGNLIHDIMAKIITKSDVDKAVNDFVTASTISPIQSEKIKKQISAIVNHPNLEMFYNNSMTIYNERDIITKDGLILRPDRLIINQNNEAVIIDYKTGLENKKHLQQLQMYQDVLQEMKILVKKKILVYINDVILVREI